MQVHEEGDRDTIPSPIGVLMERGAEITFGHSPDADDAFMFCGLAKEHVRIPGYSVGHRMEDIQTLNELSESGALPVTAISAAHYPKIASRYQIMSCGASVGRNYGPVVVSSGAVVSESDLRGKRIAVPGEFTTSWLLFQLFGPDDFTPLFLGFDAVEPAIRSGDADAGILLHEGQILFAERGFNAIMDLGKRWFDETGLPIPLGLDVVRRDLGPEVCQAVADALKASIDYAHANEDEALDYALAFGRGIAREDGRRFVRMYVNEDTADMGEDGVAALRTLFTMAEERGIIPEVPPLDIVQAS